LPKRPRRKLTKRLNGDRGFFTLALCFALAVTALFTLVLYELARGSRLSVAEAGASLLSAEWNPGHGRFGQLPFIYGTLVSSTLALGLALPLSLLSAVFLVEMCPRGIADLLSSVIELIAAIPSVVIGLWGIFVLAPVVRDYIQPALSKLSFIPLFSGRTMGLSMLTAVLVLALMITPIITSLSKEAIASVPAELKDGLYALGATRLEVMKYVVIPYAKRGILAAAVLGYARAIGETMAVTMVIGNTPVISASLLSPAYTLAAVIANEFVEATSEVYVSALVASGLILFIMSALVSLAGRALARGGVG